MDPPHGYGGIRATYGNFGFRDLPGAVIDVDDGWESANIVRVAVPRSSGAPLSIRLHHLVVPLFLEAWSAAIAMCPSYGILEVGGYAPRRMKRLTPEAQAKAPLSVHAWGAAFDVNWTTNPLQPVGDTMVTDLPEFFVRTFTDRGWTWGGSWRSIKDPMHFQYATGV